MSLEKIIAVTGKPGLYEIVAQSKGGIIVQSLVDKKRIPISAMHNVSVLENIAIYTYEGEKPLREVFKAMHEKQDGKECLSHKESAKNLTSFFSEVLPNYDDERVYTSNIKKVVQWYNLLVTNEFDFASLEEESQEDTE